LLGQITEGVRDGADQIARIEKIKSEWRKCSANLEKGGRLKGLGLVHITEIRCEGGD